MGEAAARFDRYEILAHIGAGGMGEVLKARAVGPHGFEKVVALKRIRAEWGQDADTADRFIREAQIAARLQHANIVQVFDFGRCDEELFIVMEHVDGCSLEAILHQRVERGEPFEPGQALQLVAEVARALEYAHRLTDNEGAPVGVVHRDVSPANILVSRDGAVKLTDFGIAAWSYPERTSLVAGKPPYMAPEQLRGEQVDGRADLFAIGIILYEMLTLNRPWKGIADPAKDATLESVGYEPPSAHVDGIPPELDELVAALLVLGPDERLTSARELMQRVLDISYRSQIVLDPLALQPLVDEPQDHATAPTLRSGESQPEAFIKTGIAENGATLFGKAQTQRRRKAGGSGRRAETPVMQPPATHQDRLASWPWLLGGAALLGIALLIARPWADGEETTAAAPPAVEGPTTGGSARGTATERPGNAVPGEPASTEPRQGTEGAEVAGSGSTDEIAGPEEATAGAAGAAQPEETAGPEGAAGAAAGEAVEPAATGTAEASPSGATDDPGHARAGGAAEHNPRARTEPAPEPDPTHERPAPPEPHGEAASAGAEPPPTASDAGELAVWTQPWAEIWVDGVRRGNAPARGIRVSPGTHQLRLVNPELGLSHQQTVTVTAGQTTPIRVFLR